MSKKSIKQTKRDRDPNVLQAGLQCLRRGQVEYSQGNLRIHLYRETNHGNSYAVLCGCCNNLYKDPDLLAFHLNQTGATVRAVCSAPTGQTGHSLRRFASGSRRFLFLLSCLLTVLDTHCFGVLFISAYHSF